MYSPRKIILLLVCFSVFLCSLFYLISTTAGNGIPALSEPDTRIFLQYAEKTAQGHPFTFSAGDPVSTGSTSHLYPFVLAIPALLGCKGAALISASFFINSLFYIASIILAWKITSRLHPRAAPLATILVVLSGQIANSILGMTDIGLFTVLTLGLFEAILSKSNKRAFILATLCSLTRPEGLVFSISFLICGLYYAIKKKKKQLNENSIDSLFFFRIGAIGILTLSLTLLLNYALTKHFQFMSITNKGYFRVFPFWGAVEATLFDLLRIIKGVFWGLPDTNRQFYLLPLIGGALSVSGILLTKTKKYVSICECWLGYSVLGTILVVASGQFQGISNDRYLGWVFIFWIIYASVGVVKLSEHFNSSRLLKVCATTLIIFQIASLSYMISNYYYRATETHHESTFANSISEHFSEQDTFGCSIGGALEYLLPNHKVFNLAGILSPDFFQEGTGHQMQHIIELLKKRKYLRFNYWYSNSDFIKDNPWAKPFIGEAVLTDVDSSISGFHSRTVYKANWETLDGGDSPHIIKELPNGISLIGRLDVGYIPDEKLYNYRTKLRRNNITIPIISLTSSLNGKIYSEAGRLILGEEFFTIRDVITDTDLYIILRTSRKAEGVLYNNRSIKSLNKLEISNHPSLKLSINGKLISSPNIELMDNCFTECILKIPSELIQTEKIKISIIGDHVSYGYWFYQ